MDLNIQKKYEIVYADPPWSFNNKKTGGSMKSGAKSKYDTMTVDEICELPINSITSDNAILFMWWVGSQPEEALKVVKSWGFILKTMTGFVWIKKTKNWKDWFGMGFYSRQGSENCLIAIKGKPKRINAGIRSVIEEFEEETIQAVSEIHSKKPNIFRERILDLMGELPRIELFAREKFNGWDAFGNEIEG